MYHLLRFYFRFIQDTSPYVVDTRERLRIVIYHFYQASKEAAWQWQQDPFQLQRRHAERLQITPAAVRPHGVLRSRTVSGFHLWAATAESSRKSKLSSSTITGASLWAGRRAAGSQAALCADCWRPADWEMLRGMVAELKRGCRVKARAWPGWGTVLWAGTLLTQLTGKNSS